MLGSTLGPGLLETSMFRILGYPLNEKDCLNRVTLGTLLLVPLPLLLLLFMARFFIGVYRALWERLYKRTTVLPETLDSVWVPVSLEEGLPHQGLV